MGWRAVLLDADTQVESGGPLSFEQARAEALDYIRARLAGLTPHDPATREAGLRMAFRRIERLREIS